MIWLTQLHLTKVELYWQVDPMITIKLWNVEL